MDSDWHFGNIFGFCSRQLYFDAGSSSLPLADGNSELPTVKQLYALVNIFQADT